MRVGVCVWMFVYVRMCVCMVYTYMCMCVCVCACVCVCMCGYMYMCGYVYACGCVCQCFLSSNSFDETQDLQEEHPRCRPISVTVIIIGNRIGDPSSNPRRGCLPFTDALGKGMNIYFLSQPVRQIVFLALLRQSILWKENSEFKSNISYLQIVLVSHSACNEWVR